MTLHKLTGEQITDKFFVTIFTQNKQKIIKKKISGQWNEIQSWDFTAVWKERRWLQLAGVIKSKTINFNLFFFFFFYYTWTFFARVQCIFSGLFYLVIAKKMSINFVCVQKVNGMCHNKHHDKSYYIFRWPSVAASTAMTTMWSTKPLYKII